MWWKLPAPPELYFTSWHVPRSSFGSCVLKSVFSPQRKKGTINFNASNKSNEQTKGRGKKDLESKKGIGKIHSQIHFPLSNSRYNKLVKTGFGLARSLERLIYSVFTKDTLDEKGQARDTRVYVTLQCFLTRQRILWSSLAEMPSCVHQ